MWRHYSDVILQKTVILITFSVNLQRFSVATISVRLRIPVILQNKIFVRFPVLLRNVVATIFCQLAKTSHLDNFLDLLETKGIATYIGALVALGRSMNGTIPDAETTGALTMVWAMSTATNAVAGTIPEDCESQQVLEQEQHCRSAIDLWTDLKAGAGTDAGAVEALKACDRYVTLSE